MEGRVEAADLRQPGDPIAHGADNRQLGGQVVGVERLEPMQLLEGAIVEEGRSREEIAAVDDAVPDRREGGRAAVRLEALEDGAERGGGVARSHAVDRAARDAGVAVEQPELQAGRARIEDEDARGGHRTGWRLAQAPRGDSDSPVSPYGA